MSTQYMVSASFYAPDKTQILVFDRKVTVGPNGGPDEACAKAAKIFDEKLNTNYEPGTYWKIQKCLVKETDISTDTDEDEDCSGV